MSAFKKGILAALKINFWIVLAPMIGFGSLVQSTELSLGIALGATLGLWGLPGQIAMIEMIATGAPVLAIIIASSLANLRFMPMSVVMMPLLQPKGISFKLKLVLVQLMSVNIWALTVQHINLLSLEDKIPFYFGISLTCLFGGLLGTAIGFSLAGQLPLYVSVSLVFLNPIYFVFVFSSVRQRGCIIAVIIAALFGPILHKVLPDWSVPITGIIAGSAAFYLDRTRYFQRRKYHD
tara:strand:- start:467 stop:1174 length:708 start_codon:yes stop_codon:yes gene_type:complete